jgi:hypothetical protein
VAHAASMEPPPRAANAATHGPRGVTVSLHQPSSAAAPTRRWPALPPPRTIAA